MKMTVWTWLSSSWGWMMEGLQRGWCLIMLHHHLRQKVKQIVEGPHHSYYLTLLCLFGGKFCFSPKWKFLVLCKIFKTFRNKNMVFVKTWKPDLLLATSSSKHLFVSFTQITLKGQRYLYSSSPKIVEASDENEFPIVCQWPWKEATLCRYLPRILRMIDFT